MSRHKQVDVNILLAHDLVAQDPDGGLAACVALLGDSIDSVLQQGVPGVTLTLVHHGVRGPAAAACEAAAACHPTVRRRSAGPAGLPGEGLWRGDAAFVMPMLAGDRIAGDYLARAASLLDGHPDCAMCHAAGLQFGPGSSPVLYPASHSLTATGPDGLQRACHVIAHHASAAAFHGVYRRAALDALPPIRPGPGWDHILLALLALHGEIRHIPSVLYHRRAPPLADASLARRLGAVLATAAVWPAAESLPWRAPLIWTGHAHLQAFAALKMQANERLALLSAASEIFRARWRGAMEREWGRLAPQLPAMLAAVEGADAQTPQGAAIAEMVAAVESMLPDTDISRARFRGFPRAA